MGSPSFMSAPMKMGEKGLQKEVVKVLATVINLLKSDQITISVDGKNAIEYSALVNSLNTIAIKFNDNEWLITDVTEQEPEDEQSDDAADVAG